MEISPPSIIPNNFSLVKPSAPTPSTTLSLSAIDSQPFLRFTIEYLLVFPPPSPSHACPPSAVVIKDSLSQALVSYYPLAGRIVADPNGSGKLKVSCNGQGALFIEATADNSTVSDFQKPPPSVTYWRKLMSSYSPDVLAGAPPLVLQLTHLVDGGAALVMAVSHSLCDGIGAGDFLNFFADLVTGRRRQEDMGANQPAWNRHLLDPNPENRKIAVVAHPEFQKVEDLCAFSSMFTQEKLTPSWTYFDQTQINQLKQTAAATVMSADESIAFTCFEALSGHVWRSWAVALGLPPGQKLKLVFSVNIRGKVNPKLPSSYYGNGLVMGCAQAEAGELGKKGLGYAVGLVKKAKEKVDEGFVRSVVEDISSGGGLVDMVGVLILSQWTRIGMERVDFGMGKPLNVSSVCCDRYCYFLPGEDGGGGDVKVAVAVPSAALPAFEKLMGDPTALQVAVVD